MKTIEQLYTFGHNSSYTRGFTWAMSIVARSAMHHYECKDCGTVQNYPSGAFDVMLEGGSKYPDILGCGAYPFLIVSEGVIAAWQNASINCFHTYPVGIAEVHAKKLSDVIQPRYFRVEIDGKCEIDLAKSGINLIRVCPECQRVISHPTLPSEWSYPMKPDSWNGCQIFRDPVLYPQISFCTQQMLELATQYKLTNFRFELMNEPRNPASKGIDY